VLIIEDLFKGRLFDREIIILCVRWYLRFNRLKTLKRAMHGRAGVELLRARMLPLP
jgi:transposase-like protein